MWWSRRLRSRKAAGRRAMRPVFVLPALLAVGLGLVSCADEPTRPKLGGGEDEGGSRRSPRVLGLVEVTISGLGTGEVTSSAISARSVAELERLRAARTEGRSGGLVPQAFSLPDHSAGGGDGTIQLELLSTGSFTHGDRKNGGYRYLYAAYRVRNAQADSTPYDTPRQNLTFVAVKGTISRYPSVGYTPVSQLLRFDGSPADTALAAQLIPTGAVLQARGGAIDPRYPDVLQVFTEEEATEILGLATAAGVEIEDVFPYGFVVSNAMDDQTRELPANPAPGDFHGLVTFAYKVPLQAKPADDPFAVRVVFLAVDDDEVKITQSLEEVTPAGIAAFDARAAALGATSLRLLPWGATTASSYERFCRLRIAGPAESPTAHLVVVPRDLISLTAGSSPAGPGIILANTHFTAVFDTVVVGVSPQNLVVYGNRSGRRFVDQAYSGNGTNTITTPTANFFAGEEVEVTFTSGIRSACSGDRIPATVRYRVATSPSSGRFAEGDTIVSGRPTDIVMGDVNGDGLLDLITFSDTASSQVLVLRGNGDGTFIDGGSVSVRRPWDAELGDVNGDGHPDLVVGSPVLSAYVVLLNKGDGTFAEHARLPVPGNLIPQSFAFADLDGDGDLDLAASPLDYLGVGIYLYIYLNRGDGTFDLPREYVVAPTSSSPFHVFALSDVDRDGYPDALLSVAGTGGGEIRVYRNLGDGTFQPYHVIHLAGKKINWFVPGDLNGDGAPDLLVHFSDSQSVEPILNNGDGTFGAPEPPSFRL